MPHATCHSRAAGHRGEARRDRSWPPEVERPSPQCRQHLAASLLRFGHMCVADWWVTAVVRSWENNCSEPFFPVVNVGEAGPTAVKLNNTF